MNLSALGTNLYIVPGPFTSQMVLSTNFNLANREHGIRLYRDEASRLDINKSILLPDGNFAVILSVHHNLHCLVGFLQGCVWDFSDKHTEEAPPEPLCGSLLP